MLADKDVKMVLAGRVGSNMEFALKEKGVKFKEVQDKKVKDVLRDKE